jgi:hypothetical protein
VYDVFVLFLQCDLSYRVNLLWKKKEEGQKHGQKGLFVTAVCVHLSQYSVLVARQSALTVRESTRSATPMPGVNWELKSPLKELVPIESTAGPSHDKGNGREQAEMDEGKSERAWSISLTISKFPGATVGKEWTDYS